MKLTEKIIQDNFPTIILMRVTTIDSMTLSKIGRVEKGEKFTILGLDGSGRHVRVRHHRTGHECKLWCGWLDWQVPKWIVCFGLETYPRNPNLIYLDNNGHVVDTDNQQHSWTKLSLYSSDLEYLRENPKYFIGRPLRLITDVPVGYSMIHTDNHVIHCEKLDYDSFHERVVRNTRREAQNG